MFNKFVLISCILVSISLVLWYIFWIELNAYVASYYDAFVVLVTDSLIIVTWFRTPRFIDNFYIRYEMLFVTGALMFSLILFIIVSVASFSVDLFINDETGFWYVILVSHTNSITFLAIGMIQTLLVLKKCSALLSHVSKNGSFILENMAQSGSAPSDDSFDSNSSKTKNKSNEIMDRMRLQSTSSNTSANKSTNSISNNTNNNVSSNETTPNGLEKMTQASHEMSLPIALNNSNNSNNKKSPTDSSGVMKQLKQKMPNLVIKGPNSNKLKKKRKQKRIKHRLLFKLFSNSDTLEFYVCFFLVFFLFCFVFLFVWLFGSTFCLCFGWFRVALQLMFVRIVI